MGSLILPLSGPVYIDSQIVIYTVERFPAYMEVLAPLWSAMDAGNIQLISSELLILETLIVPIRQKNDSLVADYEHLMLQSEIRLVPISQPVLHQAAQLRAEIKSLKTPDAIHAASAILEESKLFITNDKSLRSITSLQVVILDDLISKP